MGVEALEACCWPSGLIWCRSGVVGGRLLQALKRPGVVIGLGLGWVAEVQTVFLTMCQHGQLEDSRGGQPRRSSKGAGS